MNRYYIIVYGKNKDNIDGLVSIKLEYTVADTSFIRAMEQGIFLANYDGMNDIHRIEIFRQ